MSTDLLLLGKTTQSFTLESWGYNPYGQLGITPHRYGFQRLTSGVLDAGTFKQVESCNRAHFALTTGGDLYAWGLSQYIGSGDFANAVSYLTPQLVLTGVSQFSIANGSYNTYPTFLAFAVKTDGTLWMTGAQAGSWGRTSFNYSTEWNLWTEVDTVGSTCQKVSVSKSVLGNSPTVLLLKTDGTVWSIGYNGNGQLGVGSTVNNTSTFQQVKDSTGAGYLTSVSDVSMGGNTGYAVTSSGAVYGWGYNVNGEIGDGTTTSTSPFGKTLPSQCKYFATLGGAYISTALKVFGWRNGAYVTITPGTGPASYQTKTNFYGWGLNNTNTYALTSFWYGTSATGAVPIFGALSQTGTPLAEPLTVSKAMGPTGTYGISAVVTSGGRLLTWGGTSGNLWGQGGRGVSDMYSLTDTPTAVDSVITWSFLPETDASHGGYSREAAHMFAGRTYGPVYGTGANLVQSFNGYNKTNSPTQVGVNRQWAHVASGEDVSLFINNKSELIGIGRNTSYQLAANSGTYPFYSTLTQVNGSNIGSWEAVSTNGWSTAAILKGGILYAWGYNNQGECGNNTTTSIQTVTQVTRYTGGLPTSGAVSVGMCGSISSLWCGVHYDNGKVYTAGDNTFGQLGIGNYTDNRTFSPVQDYRLYDLQNVEAYWPCHNHSFVRLSVGDPASGDNNIFCWGLNNKGQLGVGNTYNETRATPSGVYDPFRSIVKIVGGDSFSIVLFANGDVEASGYNGYGQLGNGTTIDTTVFAAVRNSDDTADLTDVVDIGCTRDSAFAVLSNGDFYVWGRNTVNATQTDMPDPYYGLLVPSDNTEYFTLPTLVGNISDVVAISNTPTAINNAFVLRDV